MSLRIVSILLALVFAASGVAKLVSLPFEVEAFARWGYPPAFMYLTGVLELAGAVGLLLRPLAALAAFCLAGLMLGALGTHVLHGEWPMFALALVIASLCAWRGWVGRRELRALFRRAPAA
jgi:uncharacterized membrane protein YphA (DoxX/SURF4 family)